MLLEQMLNRCLRGGKVPVDIFSVDDYNVKSRRMVPEW